MKLPAQQRDEMINGLVKFLGPAVEPGTQMMDCSGTTLINNNVTRDSKGKQIQPGKKYLYPVEMMVPVDHKFKIAQLIDEAKDLDDVTKKLGAYLAKYAKSKDEVINANKGHFLN